MQVLSRGHPRRRRRVTRQITEHNQGEFCLFNRETCENDRFERTKHDTKKENRREIQRRNVIHGTRKYPRSIPASEGKNMSNCDLFVHHLQQKTTVAGMKSFLSENTINVRHVRLDIVSHQMATYKCFRLIAPGHYRSQLISPEFWPINVQFQSLSHKHTWKQMQKMIWAERICQQRTTITMDDIKLCSYNCKGLSISKIKLIEELLSKAIFFCYKKHGC